MIPSDQRFVGLAGDWHGDTRWARSAINAFSKAGVRTVFHLGDFGIWPGFSGVMYMQQVSEACEAHDVTIFVTPGNHEDWDALDAFFSLGPGPQKLSDHVYALPRGWRWRMLDRDFVSLGGAPSIGQFGSARYR